MLKSLGLQTKTEDLSRMILICGVWQLIGWIEWKIPDNPPLCSRAKEIKTKLGVLLQKPENAIDLIIPYPEKAEKKPEKQQKWVSAVCQMSVASVEMEGVCHMIPFYVGRRAGSGCAHQRIVARPAPGSNGRKRFNGSRLEMDTSTFTD